MRPSTSTVLHCRPMHVLGHLRESNPRPLMYVTHRHSPRRTFSAVMRDIQESQRARVHRTVATSCIHSADRACMSQKCCRRSRSTAGFVRRSAARACSASASRGICFYRSKSGTASGLWEGSASTIAQHPPSAITWDPRPIMLGEGYLRSASVHQTIFSAEEPPQLLHPLHDQPKAFPCGGEFR